MWPMAVTELGIETDLRLLQYLKSPSPIRVIPFLILTLLICALMLYHGGYLSELKFSVAPVPTMVSVSLLSVAVTSAALGKPISQVLAGIGQSSLMLKLPAVGLFATTLRR
jgi:hypothetical protein